MDVFLVLVKDCRDHDNHPLLTGYTTYIYYSIYYYYPKNQPGSLLSLVGTGDRKDPCYTHPKPSFLAGSSDSWGMILGL